MIYKQLLKFNSAYGENEWYFYFQEHDCYTLLWFIKLHFL